MPSHNLSRIKIDDIEIIGYSVAGEETVVAMPQLDVCFDIGKAPDQVISINNVLLTHGHMDHSAGIAYYLSHRAFSGLTPGTVFVPENHIEPIRQILDAWGRLDGNRIPVNLIPARPGDEYQIKPNLFTRVFPTKHSRGSVGFSVIEKRKKLKTEYAGLAGAELVELKKKGMAIDYPVEIPIATYLGDTQYVDFSQVEYISRSRFLIAECTFFMEDQTGRADAGRHIHVDDFTGLVERMENEYIIITHLSQRTPMSQVKEILRKKLSPGCYRKIILLMDRRRRPDSAAPGNQLTSTG